MSNTTLSEYLFSVPSFVLAERLVLSDQLLKRLNQKHIALRVRRSYPLNFLPVVRNTLARCHFAIIAHGECRPPRGERLPGYLSG